MNKDLGQPPSAPRKKLSMATLAMESSGTPGATASGNSFDDDSDDTTSQFDFNANFLSL